MPRLNDIDLLMLLFGAYFHQDWHCEWNAPEEAVAAYIRDTTAEDAKRTGDAVLNFNNSCANDDDLEKRLCAELGCYFLPSGIGLSAKEWLGRVAAQLFKSTNPY